jgi:hypothetical protein
MVVIYSDGLPSAIARKGMIRLVLRASDADGAEVPTCEIAVSPNIACHLIVALTDAVAQHNGAEACNVYAFRGKRGNRRRSKIRLEPA